MKAAASRIRRLESVIRLACRHILAATIVAALLLGAACDGGGDAGPTPTAPPPTETAVRATSTPVAAAPVEWEDCGDGAECGTVNVPLDYDDPVAGTIDLALVRIPATDPDNRIGSLLMNPGGPGESGVEFVKRAGNSFFSDALRERFDIVGFDPRGVGESAPAVDCVDDVEPFISEDPSPDSEAEVAEQQQLAHSIVDACEANNGPLLPHLSSDDVARDMDVIRRALGDDKLTYAGFSYGTLLGALYADRFPGNVRAMMLDGAIDPSLDALDDVRTQITGFDRALTSFLDSCAADDSCDFHAGPGTAARFDALMARIEREPLESDDGRVAGSGHAWLGVAAALYDDVSGWPLLAQALVAADENNDGTLLLQLGDYLMGRNSDGSYNNAVEARLAINCVDLRHLTEQETQMLLDELRLTAPRFGANSGLASGDPCDYWPVPPQRTARPLAAAGAPPIVVIGTTGDPATPYKQAVALADQLESGVLLTYDGEGHTAYRPGNECIQDAADAYLIDLVPPAPGTVCE